MQVESTEAVKNVKDIAAVEGVDCVLFVWLMMVVGFECQHGVVEGASERQSEGDDEGGWEGSVGFRE